MMEKKNNDKGKLTDRTAWFTRQSLALTDLHLSKLIMTMPTFRDVSKFPSVNTATISYFNGFICDFRVAGS